MTAVTGWTRSDMTLAASTLLNSLTPIKARSKLARGTVTNHSQLPQPHAALLPLAQPDNIGRIQRGGVSHP